MTLVACFSSTGRVSVQTATLEKSTNGAEELEDEEEIVLPEISVIRDCTARSRALDDEDQLPEEPTELIRTAIEVSRALEDEASDSESVKGGDLTVEHKMGSITLALEESGIERDLLEDGVAKWEEKVVSISASFAEPSFIAREATIRKSEDGCYSYTSDFTPMFNVTSLSGGTEDEKEEETGHEVSATILVGDEEAEVDEKLRETEEQHAVHEVSATVLLEHSEGDRVVQPEERMERIGGRGT